MRTALLDHGYIEIIETWGSDQRIIETARMSTNKSFLGWDPGPCPVCNGFGKKIQEVKVWDERPRLEHSEAGMVMIRGRHHLEGQALPCETCNGKGQIAGDAKLLRYLDAMKHSSPFEFAGATIEVQAPLMVFREWHRHRTQAYSELSARYTPLPDSNYMPTVDRCMIVSATNKQAGAAKGADDLTHESVLKWLTELSDVYEHAELVYQSGLRRGIPKELARLPVPVGRFSRMRATGNLRNWLLFMTLRSTLKNPAAQWEIRQYGDALGEILKSGFPRTMGLFTEPR